MIDTKSLEKITTQTRRDILRMVHKVNSGHPGGSLGCAEFLVTLFNSEMKRNKDFSMDGKDEDIFFDFDEGSLITEVEAGKKSSSSFE